MHKLWTVLSAKSFLRGSKVLPLWFAFLVQVSVCLLLLILAREVIYPYGTHPWLWPHTYGYGLGDLTGRLHNLSVLNATGNIYQNSLSEFFTYPPSSIWLFYPLTWLTRYHVLLVWTEISTFALVPIFAISLIAALKIPARLAWTVAPLLALVTFCTFPPFMELLVWGQTGTIILALIVVDLLALPKKYRGILIGVAVAIKIYPVVFVGMLLWRKEFAASVRALLSTVFITVASFILWPRSSAFFYTQILAGGKEFIHFSGIKSSSNYASSSLSSLLTRVPFLHSSLNGELKVALGLGVLVLGSWIAANALRCDLVLTAIVVASFAATLASPVSWDHYFVFVPLIPLAAYESRVFTWSVVTWFFITVIFFFPWFVWRLHASGTIEVDVIIWLSHNALGLASVAALFTGYFETRKLSRSLAAIPHGSMQSLI